jgi:hypothetical protein
MRRLFSHCFVSVFVFAIAVESTGLEALQSDVGEEAKAIGAFLPDWFMEVAMWIRIFGGTMSLPIG